MLLDLFPCVRFKSNASYFSNIVHFFRDECWQVNQFRFDPFFVDSYRGVKYLQRSYCIEAKENQTVLFGE